MDEEKRELDASRRGLATPVHRACGGPHATQHILDALGPKDVLDVENSRGGGRSSTEKTMLHSVGGVYELQGSPSKFP